MLIKKVIRVVDAKVVEAKPLDNGDCELTLMVNENETISVPDLLYDPELFKSALMEEEQYVKSCEAWELVEASELSMNDAFMQYKPKSLEVEVFKRELAKIIQLGVKDFWRPKYDPSLTEDGKGICFEPGKRPAVGKSYSWWKKVATEFDKECGSRLGTKFEYVAFLGVLIKRLVEEENWPVVDAWEAICKDSYKLGNYLDSKDSEGEIAPTGTREVVGFCDLGNTCKILERTEGKRWIAGGAYDRHSKHFPLSSCYHDVLNANSVYTDCVGWIVCEN